MSTATSTSRDTSFAALVDSLNRQYQTVGDLVYDILREGIVRGVFTPGEHLRQDELASKIGVSRMPVRSALLRLEAEGLVDFHPHRGATVRRLTVDEVKEIYELRIMLETRALSKTMANMTAERLNHLSELVQALNTASDNDEFLHLHVAFYRELYDAHRQPVLVNLIERLRDEVGRYWIQRRRDESSAEGGGSHDRILAHLSRGENDQALAALEAHLHDLCAELVARIQGPIDGPTA